MPRYEDRYGSNTRLYVGHLSSRTRSRDLENIFSRYGRVRDVDMKRDYAFVEFSNPRDADDAIYYLDGRDVDGRHIIVEFAKGIPRGPGGVREYAGRGPAPGSGRCFNCGIGGHWARDCKAGDWKNKCYLCGERGHIERNCPNSPTKMRRGRSYSLSPVRSPSPRRGRKSRSRSYSRSRSPARKERYVKYKDSRSRSPARKEQYVEYEDSPSRSPSRSEQYFEYEERSSESPGSKSPELKGVPSPSKGSKCSPTPDNNSPRERVSSSPHRERLAAKSELEGYSDCPKEGSQSPSDNRDDESPYAANRYSSPSPSLRDDTNLSIDDNNASNDAITDMGASSDIIGDASASNNAIDGNGAGDDVIDDIDAVNPQGSESS